MKFVLDNSVAMCWLLNDGNPAHLAYAAQVLEALETATALVPGIWPLEAANVLVKAEARGLVDQARMQNFVGALQDLGLIVDKATVQQALGETLNLARRYKLSAYDAAYLELALRESLPLATLDAALGKAAQNAGVPRYL